MVSAGWSFQGFLRRASAPLLLCVLLFVSCGGGGTARVKEPKRPVIAVVQFVQHPTLDRVREGFTSYFAQQGRSVDFRNYNAQGDFPTAAMIAQQLRDGGADLVFVITTPAAQACATAIRTTPVVFGAVTDPVSAGLVASLERPGRNVTGVSDMTPMDPEVELILEIQPTCRTLGTIYNASESNSRTLIGLLRDACRKRNLTLKEATVSSSSEVLQASMGLVGQVDAMFMTQDNTVASGFEGLLKPCRDNRRPLYAAESASVSLGAIAAVSLDYSKLGAQSAAMVERILNGAKPGETPVETQKDLGVYVNREAADWFRVTLPESVLQRAVNQ